jgi:hypothetical protein
MMKEDCLTEQLGNLWDDNKDQGTQYYVSFYSVSEECNEIRGIAQRREMKVTASRISRLHYPAKKQGTH